MQPRDTHNAADGITCLNCGQAQLPPGREKLSNWNCGYCHSGLLSIPMLSNLAPRELIRQLTSTGRKGEGRACPLCTRDMVAVKADFNKKKLDFEVCRRCRIVWFDSGELLRGLRHRAPENEAPDEHGRVGVSPLRGVVDGRRPGSGNAPVRQAIRFAPRVTYLLVFACFILMPLATHFPELVVKYGFFPSAPLRSFGLTWITSLFLHDKTAYALLPINMVLLFLIGGYVEERLGIGGLLRLFLASGVGGRVAYLLAVKGEAPYLGTTASIAGVVAYAAIVFPYGQVFFPSEHKWRSQRNAVSWIAVTVLTVTGFLIGCNFIASVLNKVAFNGDANAFSDSWLSGISAFIATPEFGAAATGAAVGVICCLVESVSGLATAEPAPAKAAKPLPRTRLRM